MSSCPVPDCFIDAEPAPELEATSPMELIFEVKQLVDCCLLHGTCFFIIDVGTSGRYVQCLFNYQGYLIVESVSNNFVDGPCAPLRRLTDADHATLLRLGWRPPDGIHSPNWFRSIDWGWHYPSPLIAELLVRTLLEVHDATPDDLSLTVAHAHVPPRPRRTDRTEAT